MRSAHSTALYSGLLGVLLAGSAAAAPVITNWDVVTDGAKETINLSWSEEGSVEVHRFQAARQITMIMPEATMGSGDLTTLNVGNSRLLDRARLQEVTLPNGSRGVQLTVDLFGWSNPEIVPSTSGVALEFDVPADTPPVSDISITDSDIVDVMLSEQYGSPNAPRTGAGQDGGDGAFSGFYTPPEIDRKAQAAESGVLDIYSLDVERKLDERIRQVDFKSAPLLTVLRVVADKGELNILVNPNDARGNVSLKLRDITFRHLLEAVLKSNNLGYKVEDGGILRIVPRSQVEISGQETVTRTIPVNWIDAEEASEALEDFLGDDGEIQVAQASNSLIVRDVPENVQQIEDIIQRIDIAEKQVLMEVRLVDMTEDAMREIGFRTNVQQDAIGARFTNGTGTLTGTNTISDTLTDTLTNSSSSSLSDSFGRGIGETPTGSSSTSSSGSNSASSSMTNSIANTLTESFTDTLIRVPETAVSAGALPAAEALTARWLSDVSLFGNDYLIDMELAAQETRGEAVVLANPTVLSLNNQAAIVEIQRREPYIQAVNSDQGSVATVAFEDIGTRVEILPRITNNGFVQMEIMPEQRILRGFRNVTGPGGVQSVPLVDERNVTTSVIVRDEQTVALGGLRQFTSTASETGVPFLLRLPVLSWLFKSQSNQQTKTDLYLFVTPHIIKNPELSPYETAIYEKIDYNWDLPDYYFDEIYPRKSAGEVDPRIKE